MTENRLDGRTLVERLTIPSEGYNYESPVALIQRKWKMELETQIENEIVARVNEQIDIEVNKEELLKALQYDRGQYDKGFADGLGLRRPKKVIWGKIEFTLAPDRPTANCPNCKRKLRCVRIKDNYCPKCGQALDWSEE